MPWTLTDPHHSPPWQSRISDLPNKKNGFQIISNKKALVVYSDTEEKRAEWKKVISDLIGKINGVGTDKVRLFALKAAHVSFVVVQYSSCRFPMSSF